MTLPQRQSPAKSRVEAAKLGLTRYFSGAPCKYGHLVDRALSGNCVECQRLHKTKVRDPEKRREYYLNNKSAENENSKKYHERYKVRRSLYGKEYRGANRDTVNQKNSAWRAKNPEYGRVHRKEKSHLYQVYAENRRARISDDRLSVDIVERLMRLQKGRCAACRKPLRRGTHLDHVIPLARGGRNIDSNVQLLHGKCNSSKGSRDPIEFMQSKGLLL